MCRLRRDLPSSKNGFLSGSTDRDRQQELGRQPRTRVQRCVDKRRSTVQAPWLCRRADRLVTDCPSRGRASGSRPPYRSDPSDSRLHLGHPGRGGRRYRGAPSSCRVQSTPCTLSSRGAVLEGHTLVAVMLMPEDLFCSVGTVTCLMVFRTRRLHAFAQMAPGPATGSAMAVRRPKPRSH